MRTDQEEQVKMATIDDVENEGTRKEVTMSDGNDKRGAGESLTDPGVPTNPGSKGIPLVPAGPPVADPNAEMHDPGPDAVNRYEPVGYELEVLARYWIREKLDIKINVFFSGQIGGRDGAKFRYAEERLKRIADVVGEAAVNEIVAEEEDVERRKMGERYWRIFQDGTREERDQVARETCEGSGGMRAPVYAISELAAHAVARFPELHRSRLADAMHFAATRVEKGEVESPACDHAWIGYDKLGMERCEKCDALRMTHVSRPPMWPLGPSSFPDVGELPSRSPIIVGSPITRRLSQSPLHYGKYKPDIPESADESANSPLSEAISAPRGGAGL